MVTLADTLAHRDYLRVLRRGWHVVLVFAVLGGGVGWGIALASTKVYRASVQLFVATASPASPSTQWRVQSFTSIATSPAVTGPVIHALRLSLTEADLAAKISTDVPGNKVLINLHVTDHDPHAATTIANAVASQFATVVEKTEQTHAHGTSPVRLAVIRPATVPASPIRPDAALNIGLGVLVGLLLGVGVLIARDRRGTPPSAGPTCPS